MSISLKRSTWLAGHNITTIPETTRSNAHDRRRCDTPLTHTKRPPPVLLCSCEKTWEIGECRGKYKSVQELADIHDSWYICPNLPLWLTVTFPWSHLVKIVLLILISILIPSLKYGNFVDLSKCLDYAPWRIMSSPGSFIKHTGKLDWAISLFKNWVNLTIYLGELNN